MFDFKDHIAYNINVDTLGESVKWTKHELFTLKEQELDFESEISFEKIPAHMGIRRLENIHVSGRLFYEKDNDHVLASLRITGTMIVPCAITLDDVDYVFETSADLVYGFNDENDPDVILIEKDGLDLSAGVLNAIWLEKPITLVKPGLKSYPKGDGWEVISEEDYQKSKSTEIDPRLAILKDYKQHDE
ncbi:MAG: hypothetical protein FD133_597 [Erysipelotrichaceae bacterium]|nr:MAG: hypothetical protein FD179_613 [Erysipelotrichaceae bacterium]TXT18932.1 MAG: hypothetical protein FD133_597 [Erysipelotrichaceae bacterium]